MKIQPIEPVLTDRMGATYLPVLVAPITVLITRHPIFLSLGDAFLHLQGQGGE